MKQTLASVALLLTAACSSPDKPAEQPSAVTPTPSAAAPATTAGADTARQRFTWQDEVCTVTGYFAPGQYTKAQLDDSYKLVVFPYAVSRYNESIWELAQFQPDSISFRLRRLEAEHREAVTVVRGLRVVPVAYWQQLQQMRLAEVEEFYQLRKLTLQAYFKPQLLVGAPQAGSCRPYVQALTTPDTQLLLRAWRELVDAQKKDNGDPERLEAKYQEQYASPERLRYARLELMVFGWSNCANAQRRYVDLEEQQRPSAAFDKLFSKVVRTDCEDVD